MKKIISVLCILLLACLTPIGSLAETLIVYTRGGPVNIRKTPDMNDRSAVSIPKGESVEVIEYVNKSFVKVRWQDQEGYVPAQYVKTEEEVLKKDYPKGKSVYPDAPMIYVRSAASDGSAVIAAVPWDRPVTILKEGNGWAQVACLNQSGSSVKGFVKASDVAGRNAQPLGGNLFASGSALWEEGEAEEELILREFPDAASEVCARVPKGHTVTVLDIREPWCKIAVDAYQGWAHVENVRMTGNQAEIANRDTFENYRASYYTATPAKGSVTLYPEPSQKKGGPSAAYDSQTVAQWIVLERSKTASGQTWSNIWDGKSVSGWVLSSSLLFSEERQEMDYGDAEVKAYTSAIAYVKEDGAAFYEAGTDISKKLFTIPAGTELEISLHPGNFASASYGGRHGYVPYDQIETGFAWDRDWWNRANDPEGTEEKEQEQPMIEQDAARVTAEAALRQQYGGFDPARLTLKTEKQMDASGVIRYSFAYFQGEDCLYIARVNAHTGACDYKADYTPFVTRSGGDSAVDWDPDAPQKRAKATPRPSAAGDVGMEKARAAADQAVRDTYGIDLNSFKCEAAYQRQMPGFDVPAYRFNYIAENGYALCVVDAASGAVLHTSNVYNAEYTEIDYDPPQATPKPDYSGYALLSQTEARQKADAALSAKYAHFSISAIASVSCRFIGEGQGDPYFGENYYDFTYFDADNRMQFSCIVNGYTGKILYLFGNLPGEGNG